MTNNDIALQNSNGSPNSVPGRQTEVQDPKTEVPHLGSAGIRLNPPAVTQPTVSKH